MGFCPNEGEYVDYTLLTKKGILKVPETKSLNLSNDDGFIDVSSAMKDSLADNSYSSPAPTQESSSSSAPNMDFLGALAGVGSSESPPSQSYPSYPSSSSIPDNSDVTTLKVKLDDFEYKLERLIERIAKIEELLANKQI